MAGRVKIHRYEKLLREIGLADTQSVRAWAGEPLKQQRGRRDVHRIVAGRGKQQRTLFLKRNLKAYRKHALASLLRRGRVVSAAETEADSLAALEAIGAPVSPCVAVGAEIRRLTEHFSFIITEAAPGRPLDEILADRPTDAEIDRIGRAVLQLVRRIHDAGVGIPTLMARHIFVDAAQDEPGLCLIDVDRLVHRRNVWALRVRDLAQLHLSIPLSDLGLLRRVRLLRLYAGGDRSMTTRLLRAIARRSNYLLMRRRRRAEAFLHGLKRPVADAVMRRAEAAWNRWKWIAAGANALSGGAGLALLWVAYALGSRDLFPLDEASEWSALVDHIDDATPQLHSLGWLMSSPGLLGLGLLIVSLLAANWLRTQQRRG